MEPQIQYANTSDGVSIAFWTIGEGPALVSMGDAPYSHIRLEWHTPEVRSWYESLSSGRTLVRYDQRGGGLSDQAVSDFSLDAFQMDLAAVVNRLQLDKFALFAMFASAPVAIAFAARNPDRVSSLILWCAAAKGAAWAALPKIQAVRALMDEDWELYTETLAHVALGWSAGESARRTAAMIREAYTRETTKKIYEAVRDFDATGYLHQVRAPTLVLHRRLSWFPEDASRLIASRIPDARLAILDGASALPFLDDWQAALETVEGFLREGDTGEKGWQRPPPSGTAPPEAGTAIILFLDIAGSTELTTKLGDAAYREKERALDGVLRQAVREAGGSPVDGKVLGDGVMATFASAKDAINAAMRCQSLGDGAGLPLHLGIHAGDVTREGNNVHGGAVQVAARIADASAPGEVFVSQTVRDLARTSAGVLFEERGEHELKGVAEPVRVFAVRTGQLPPSE